MWFGRALFFSFQLLVKIFRDVNKFIATEFNGWFILLALIFSIILFGYSFKEKKSNFDYEKLERILNHILARNNSIISSCISH